MWLRNPLQQLAALSSFVVALAASSNPAMAHHAMDGKLPSTLIEGLASGLAHPVIGLDHFAFVVAVGILAYLANSKILMPVLFVTGTLAGTVLHLTGADLLYTELAIAISVLLAGLALLIGKPVANAAIGITAVAIAGIFHGYAYGESIIGAETTPLAAYLIGFALVQASIAVTIAFAMQWLHNAGRDTAATPIRLFAALTVCAIGVYALAGQTGLV